MTHSVATETIRILLIDDHALVRAGLRLLIETYPGFRVVGEAGNRVDAVNLAGGRGKRLERIRASNPPKFGPESSFDRVLSLPASMSGGPGRP